MKKINYGILKPGYIIGTTTTVHPMAMTTKVTTAGLKNIFNPNIATHCLAVCQEHDLLYGMGMEYPKIRQVDLCDYEHCKLLEHIVFVAAIDGDCIEEANRFLLESHRQGVRYDVAGLLEFWGLAEDDKHKLYCSELIRQMYRHLGIDYPVEWNYKVSPYEIQKFTVSKHIKWWKRLAIHLK